MRPIRNNRARVASAFVAPFVVHAILWVGLIALMPSVAVDVFSVLTAGLLVASIIAGLVFLWPCLHKARIVVAAVYVLTMAVAVTFVSMTLFATRFGLFVIQKLSPLK